MSLITVGTGSNSFFVDHNWLKFGASSNKFPLSLNVTGVAEDPKTGELYVSFMDLTDCKHDRDSVFVFDRSGKYLHSLARESHGGAHGVCFAEIKGKKMIYVSCKKTNCVYVYNASTGDLVHKIKLIPLFGKASQPSNVVVLPDGEVVVLDVGSASIQRRHFTYTCRNELHGDLNEPHGIAFVHHQYIVSDRGNSRLIGIPTRAGNQRVLPAKNLRAPCSVSFNPSTRQYVVADRWHAVWLFDENWNQLECLGDGKGKHHCDVAGKTYSADCTGTLRGLLVDGRCTVDSLDPGFFLYPHCAIWTSSGDIVVAESNGVNRGSGIVMLRRCK